jgi:RNA-directed DNA polymerase
VAIPKDKNKDNFRPLVVAKVESRIVQRAIHDVLVTVPSIKQFVITPHSFGGVKKQEDDEFAAVPAAIQAVLKAIGNGGRYIIRSDISVFFTKISKPLVTEIVAKAVGDNAEFIDLFGKAIAVELENMSQLNGRAAAFPIYEIGVAQGNSLSPLLGNLVLYEFDHDLNKHADVRCIRYIDDFIVIAPSREIAENTFSSAIKKLKNLGMEVSASKTQRAKVEDAFEFLGIEFANGFLRPCKKSQDRIIKSATKAFFDSVKAFRESTKTNAMDQRLSLIETLSRISGIMQGWGKHYFFCNDSKCFEHLDKQIEVGLRHYLAAYRDERQQTDDLGRWRLLGIEALGQIERTPFDWPKKHSKKCESVASIPLPANSIAVIDSESPPWGEHPLVCPLDILVE